MLKTFVDIKWLAHLYFTESHTLCKINLQRKAFTPRSLHRPPFTRGHCLPRVEGDNGKSRRRRSNRLRFFP